MSSGSLLPHSPHASHGSQASHSSHSSHSSHASHASPGSSYGAPLADPLDSYGAPVEAVLGQASEQNPQVRGDGAGALKMLMATVPGVPGEDYPILSTLDLTSLDTGFSCIGKVPGGEELPTIY